MILDSPERFEMGRVVSRALGVLGRNWLGFGLSAAFLTLPLLGFELIGGNPSASNSGNIAAFVLAQKTALQVALGLASVIFFLVAGLVLQAALVQATITDLNGERPQLGACMATGLRNFFPLLFITILYGLAVAFGFILLIVPGFMALCALSVAVPVRVVEQLGITESLGRSADLTRGHRWKIFLLFLLALAISTVIGLPAGIWGALIPGAAQPVMVGLTQWIARIISALLNSAGVASVYYELRLVKEGMGATELAAAFD